MAASVAAAWLLSGLSAPASAGSDPVAVVSCDAEQRQRILPEPPVAEQSFGRAVAVGGSRLFASSPGAAVVAVYRQGETAEWIVEATLTAADSEEDDDFATAIAAIEERVLVGARRRDTAGADAGTAFVFELVDEAWMQVATLVGDGAQTGDEAGTAVALGGKFAVVGAPRADVRSDDDGAAFVFRRAGGVWEQDAEISATDGQRGDGFGSSIASDGARIAVGAPKHDCDDGNDCGRVLVYRRDPGVWQFEQALTAATPTAGARFGGSVAIHGQRLVVAAADEDGDTGFAYPFELSDGVWSPADRFRPAEAGAGAEFGRSVALDGTFLAIGAIDDDANDPRSGAVYLFDAGPDGWRERARLSASDGSSGDEFGRSVSVAGGRLAVGAPLSDVAAFNAGALYAFDEVEERQPGRLVLCAHCADGRDNDGDGATDFPDDEGCTERADRSEFPDCFDGLDNDDDGRIDFPSDPHCADANDESERRCGPESAVCFSLAGVCKRCGQPNSGTDGTLPTATDALFVLRAAVNLLSCRACVCDVDSNGGTTATDALRVLKRAVGQNVEVACPFGDEPALTTTTLAPTTTTTTTTTTSTSSTTLHPAATTTTTLVLSETTTTTVAR